MNHQELIERLRVLEIDHEPNGWPAIQMRDISAMCDAIESLLAENERLKLLEESALKVCSELDNIVMVMPYDYLDPPDGGNVPMSEQISRMWSEVKTLRENVACVTDLRAELAKYPLDASLLKEVYLINDAYVRIRSERLFAIDDLEYDLFSAGWKAAVDLIVKPVENK